MNAPDGAAGRSGHEDGIPALEAETLGLVELVATAEAMAARGASEAALGLYDRWLRRNGTDRLRYAVHFNHGVLLSQAGHPAEAATAYAEAIRLNPAFLPAYINAGLAFERLGRLDLAAGQWLHVADQVTAFHDETVSNATTALKHLSRVFKGAGDIRSAEAALDRSLTIDPHQRDAIQHWIALRQMQCKWPAIATVGRLTRGSLTDGLSPLSLAIHADDPMFQLANASRHFALDVARSAGSHTAGPWPPPEAASRAGRRLRIGYVSPDLREHAIGFLTAELFELHDRARVEVFAFYSGRGGPDPLQARIRGAVDHWRDIAGLSDRRAAGRIVADEIDILVDLGGYTGDAPTATFALRPAPVIVNWLGFPGSMGTPHHQYIIADDEIIPTYLERYYSERVLRLPCYQPTDRKRIVAEPAPSRLEAGLPEDDLVFCCFNGTQKITPPLFACWMTILGRVPGAVLWLLSCDAATDERLRQEAARQAVAPERLIFAPRLVNAEHLARYRLADLFLDTFPYGAHTTASDALWMGVPVLTVAGRSFASRVCASLARAAGLGDFACDSLEGYTNRAVELGCRPAMLAEARSRLQSVRERSTLFDMTLLVARLEGLYEQMWDEHSSGRLPRPDLTNLTMYNEIGAELLDAWADMPDREGYETAYLNALTYRDSVARVPPDRRLWPGRVTD